MSLMKVIDEAAGRLGLTGRGGGASRFGEIDGFPVQLLAGQDGGAEVVVTLVRHGRAGTGTDAGVLAAVQSTPAVLQAGVKPDRVQAADGLLVHRPKQRSLRKAKADEVAHQARALLEAVKAAVPESPTECLGCDAEGEVPVTTLDGVVTRTCATCLAAIQAESERLRAAYDALPTRWALAMATGGVLAVLGAVAWAGVAVATDRIFWLVAIGIGWMVGVGVGKAAHKGGLGVQALIAGMTVFSVLLGQVLLIAWHVQAAAASENASVHWPSFLAAAPELLVATGTDTLFALAGGVFGAVVGARMGARAQVGTQVGA